MVTITLHTDTTSRTIDLSPGETVLTALRRNGWHLTAPCGGVGKCGKCIVRIDPADAGGPRDPAEERYTGSDPAIRLACRLVPVRALSVYADGSLTPPAAADTVAKGGSIELPAPGVPVVIAETIEVDPPSLQDQRSVLRRLRAAAGIGDLHASVHALTAAADALASPAAAHGMVTAIIEAGTPPRLLTVRSDQGDHHAQAGPYALAVDIGTTTVAAYLIDLGTHTVTASRSEANAQGSYGADVISRIAAYTTGAPLTQAIRRQIARLAEALAADAGIAPTDVSAASIVGNTTMIHLFTGLDPEPMSRAPFIPTLTESVRIDAGSLELPLMIGAGVRIPPGVSAYVGTDITADLVACRMHHEEGVSLLVDIGTNGEIVLGGREGLLACSTAAGPAFEGATIRHGSGGVAGAINHVRREGDRLVVQTIGGAAARSICGTGLMDALALLLDDGLVDETGRIDPDNVSQPLRGFYQGILTEIDGDAAVVVSGTRERPQMVLTQSDIRQVQLAKGAIAAGIRVLMHEAGVTADDIRRVYLAGGFGTYVTPASAVRVGVLPGIAVDRIVAIGNAAGAGAARLLVDRDAALDAEQVIGRCRYLELSGSAAFQDYYMEEMMF